jgi:carboxyl-terminal processing protease
MMAILAILAYACSDDENGSSDDESVISEETIATNSWIFENMELYYLWNDLIPSDIDYKQESDPEAYFYKLLYDDKDKWSWITDDYKSLEADLNGEPVTMGYYPSFYLYGNDADVFIVVNYVYPGSVAEKAGLKRGDIILSIDNTTLDTINYYDLYLGTNYSVQLGEIKENTLAFTGESVDLTAQATTTNPAIYHSIYEINGYKIGYLVYTEFICGDGNEFLTELDNVFNEFKTAGISDLIVDLRYNPGGSIDAAAYLASEIAQARDVLGEAILVNMQYNDDLQNYLESYASRYADYLSYRFNSKATNANLDRVYFLTTNGTASASELVISCLAPYMNVIQIGESTFGKYTGAWIITDDNEEWAIIPVVLKYSNINGYTDFYDGLTPDYEIDNDLLSTVPFGDTSDPMLAKAIEMITGTSVKKATSKFKALPEYRRIMPEKMLIKNNLYLPKKALSISYIKPD